MNDAIEQKEVELKPEVDSLVWAHEQVRLYQPQLSTDISKAYELPFVEAAAILYIRDRPRYERLTRNVLKPKQLRITNWEREVRKRALELERKERLQKQKAAARVGAKPDLEPWQFPVDGKQLLDSIVALVKRFLILPPLAAEAIALWILHTHCIDATVITPRLAIKSVFEEEGKTRVLDVLEPLCRRPRRLVDPSAAAIFHAIEDYEPTLLIDEADLGDRGERGVSQALRKVLNSGFQRGTYVSRVGKDYHTFAAAAIASIGSQPRTWESRSVVIYMRRATPSELKQIEEFDFAASQLPVWSGLRRQCVRWAIDHTYALKSAKPQFPPGITGRQRDCWRILFAIADVIDPNGTGWSNVVRMAAVSLATRRAHDDERIEFQLLRDLREIFDKVKRPAIFSRDIVAALVKCEHGLWTEYKGGRAITMTQLGHLLREKFQVYSTDVHIGDEHTRGYEVKDFQDAFARYIPRISSDDRK